VGTLRNICDRMAEQEKKTSYEEMFNKKERLKIIKKGILNYLYSVGEANRDRIAAKIQDLQIYQDPYEVFSRGGKSRKMLVNPTNEEVNYCLNFLKKHDLIEYNERRKLWILKDDRAKKKKGQTLDNFLSD
jgi:site-specific recombinase XerD